MMPETTQAINVIDALTKNYQAELMELLKKELELK